MKKLTFLDLSACHLSPASGAALAAALVSGTCLSFVKVSKNDLGNEGTKQILVILKTNITITAIDLSNNHLTEECAPLVEELISNNPVLHTLK
jgi:Ran GTPase-activating protein (RanGAP) involved in mRNA processing and transport